MKKIKAFTLLEILIVIAIIGLFLALSVKLYNKARERQQRIEKEMNNEFVIHSYSNIDYHRITVIKHTLTNILYLKTGDHITVLLDKEGKPLISY